MVEFQVQVVLILAYLRRSVQVATLEARLKEKRRVVRPLQVVILVQAIEVASVDHLSVM